MPTLEQQLAEAKEMLARIEQQIADAAKPKEWPQADDAYWVVNNDGSGGESRWLNDETDRGRAAIGGVFRTEAEAMQEVERRKVLTELRKLARESWGEAGGPDWWSANQGKWEICFAHREGKFSCCQGEMLQTQGSVHFATSKSAQEAIQTIGADRLKLLLEN